MHKLSTEGNNALLLRVFIYYYSIKRFLYHDFYQMN